LERKVTQSTYIAQAVTRFTNPSILSPVTLLLITYTESSDIRELVSLVAIIILFLILIPVVYVYIRISSSGNRTKSVVELTTFLKRHPRDILILTLLPGLSCLAILSFLKAPAMLISTLVALLAGSFVTALFNMFYRVSFHLTGITILIVMLAEAWSQVFLVLLAAIPLIAWAKFHIHDHSILQLAMGIIVAVAVSLVTLHLFGLRALL
jgi:hypothetical protein